jgi:diguanylate cyclase (GGDEF)-like protein
MITALWEATQQLQVERDRLLRLATRDCLTGVWNRQAIFDLLRKALARAQRESRPVTVIMADIDRFKSINDRFGHPAGDAVLQEVARRLQACVRRSDEVGRFGGEEFLILLPGCSARAAMARAEHFRVAIGSKPIPFAGGQLHVTCSFGLHSVSGRTYDGDEAISKADAALYQAKRMGRDRCVALHE